MKLNINTTDKIIRLEEQVNLGELFTFLEEILPDLKWREYSIEVNVVNNWGNPIYTPPFMPYTPVNPIYNPTTPTYPSNPWITYCTSTDKVNG